MTQAVSEEVVYYPVAMVEDLSLFGQVLVDRARQLFAELDSLSESDKVAVLNALRAELHRHSPFASEPVDCVQWIKIDAVTANDYNPNTVAPPEMRLLEHSIAEDGYTQPIVAWRNADRYEVVDGFHRNRVGRESAAVRKRIKGYLPLTIINSERLDRGDRIAATIRHNRARGKHRVDAMSDIVVELKRRNWSNERIGTELGMDPDEVLRLSQISGLSEMFADRQFTEAWEHTGPVEEIHAEEEDLDAVSAQPGMLEWMRNVSKQMRSPGWHDRTENSSILYGDSGNHLAMIQRSRFADEWFFYVYVQPMQEGRAPSKQEAQLAVAGILTTARGQ